MKGVSIAGDVPIVESNNFLRSETKRGWVVLDARLPTIWKAIGRLIEMTPFSNRCTRGIEHSWAMTAAAIRKRKERDRCVGSRSPSLNWSQNERCSYEAPVDRSRLTKSRCRESRMACDR